MIVVTTPTGNIGHLVVQHLLDAGEPVRVVVRGSDRLPANVIGKVKVIEGSHGDAVTIDKALAGAEALLWIAPPTPMDTLDATYIDFTRPAAEAIRRHGVARVVAVAGLGRGTKWQDKAGMVTAGNRMIDLLNATGAAVRCLAMPAFMENALQQVDAIKGGKMFGPLDPDNAMPYTATRDMAAVAARLLADRSWSGQEEVPLLGPQDLSANDIAATVGEVLGREVVYQQVPFDGFKKQLLGSGMSEAFAQGFIDMMRAKNEGMDNAVTRSSATIGPTTFRQWCEDTLRPAALE